VLLHHQGEFQVSLSGCFALEAGLELRPQL
jgi:hypothetical protein